MRADHSAAPRIGIRCDAGRQLGVGHLVRCVALAEEMTSRGWQVEVFGDLGGLAFAERQVLARGLGLQPVPAEPVDQVRALRAASLDALVVDSYTLPNRVTTDLADGGLPLLALVDGALRGQRAHVYVDQNIGAEADAVDLPDGSSRLAGTDYALLRDAVRTRRPRSAWSPRGETPSIVVSFGGTDAFGMTAVAVEALAAAGEPFSAIVVSVDDAVGRRVAELSLPPGASLTVSEPFDDFPAALAGADLVLGAAGTSVWEYCCLGLPAAVTAVAENQQEAYGRLVNSGTMLPLGTLTEIRADAATFRTAVKRALLDEGLRTATATSAYALVDGEGRVRVVDALSKVAGLA
jgi:spore coat polysaccharide biosynthesis predicted glycosyltransferase SpsG